MIPTINANIVDADKDSVAPKINLAMNGSAVPPATSTSLGGVYQTNPIADAEYTAQAQLPPTAPLNDVIMAVNVINYNVDQIHRTLDQLMANLRGSGVIDKNS